MPRILPALAATAALAVPAAASAQIPAPPGQQPAPQQPAPAPAPPAAQPAAPGLTVALASGVRSGGNTYSVAAVALGVRGHINPAAAGESVRVELWRGGKLRAHRRAKVGKKGNFSAQLRPRVAGRYRVRATHARSAKVAKGASKAVSFSAIRGSASTGARGIRVKLLQQQLAALAYAVPKSGRYDDATARAVIAYRKVNRMRRISSANRVIFKRLFRGQGTFRLRYPKAGKHVEADLRRQVVVLARNGRPWRIYHMSSGKPSTPTVTGSYRFYSKTPGFNAKAMYYSNYFIRGYAIHGYQEVPAYNASHGCIRVPLSNAVSIYRWISLGDRIFVYGHA